MRPPKRQKKNTEAFGPSAEGERLWNVEELKALLKALKSCPVDDYDAIKQYLPERSLNEVKVALERLRTTNPAKVFGTRGTAPIEMWLQKSEQLQRYDFDHSHVLGQVVSTMATLEPRARKKTSADPNYKALYRYLAALLNKESPPTLAKMDAVVLLDILDGLADHLKSLDTTDQQALMRQKYQLLRSSVNLYSQRDTLVAVKKRLREDTFKSCRQPPAPDSRPDPPESTNGRAPSGSNGGGHTGRTTDGPRVSGMTGEAEHDGKGTGEDQEEQTEAGTQPAKRSTTQESTTQESTTPESTTPESTTQESSNDVCGLYCLNPFCIEQKYLEPETNSL